MTATDFGPVERLSAIVGVLYCLDDDDRIGRYELEMTMGELRNLCTVLHVTPGGLNDHRLSDRRAAVMDMLQQVVDVFDPYDASDPAVVEIPTAGRYSGAPLRLTEGDMRAFLAALRNGEVLS